MVKKKTKGFGFDFKQCILFRGEMPAPADVTNREVKMLFVCFLLLIWCVVWIWKNWSWKLVFLGWFFCLNLIKPKLKTLSFVWCCWFAVFLFDWFISIEPFLFVCFVLLFDGCLNLIEKFKPCLFMFVLCCWFEVLLGYHSYLKSALKRATTTITTTKMMMMMMFSNRWLTRWRNAKQRAPCSKTQHN